MSEENADLDAGDESVDTSVGDESTDTDAGDDTADTDTGDEAADASDESPDEVTAPKNGGDETVPRVDLSLYELSVSVSGRSDDELEDVEESATRLMDYLVSHSEEMEEEPDEYGLS